MGVLANGSVDNEMVVVRINDEKHVLDSSNDLSESLNDYLRRKTRFKVDHSRKPSLHLLFVSLGSYVCKLFCWGASFQTVLMAIGACYRRA